MPDAIDVFISYAPRDAEHLADLSEHLALLQSQGLIATWGAHDLQPGADRATEIAEHLEGAGVVLFLVSPSFVASEELWGAQLQQALARRASHGTRVVPIIVRPVDWESSAELARLQVLPAGGQPVTSWDDADAAWTDVAKSLRRMLVRRPRRRARRPRPVVMPEAVPFRVDRDPQLDALRDALRQSRAVAPRGHKRNVAPKGHKRNVAPPRPVVAVAWGGEHQGQDALVERLTGEALRQLLHLPEERKLHDHLLRWPADWRQRPERPLERLGEEVVGDDSAGAARIDAAWGSDPVLVYTMLDDGDWRREGTAVVSAFAELWRGWSELAAGQALVALLTFEIDAARRGGVWPWRGRPSRREARKIGARLEGALAGDDRIVGVVLPPLGAVKRRDALDWARQTARDYGWPAGRLLRPVDDFYHRRGARALPMDDLTDELRRILEGALFPQEVPT